MSLAFRNPYFFYIVCAVLLFIYATKRDILETALPFDPSEKSARDCFCFLFLHFVLLCDPFCDGDNIFPFC